MTTPSEQDEVNQELSGYPLPPPAPVDENDGTDSGEPESGSAPEPESEFPETGLTAEDEEEIFGVGDETDPADEPDDFSDVLEVTNEDIMGKESQPKQPKKLKRTVRRYVSPPPSSLGGIQY